MGLMVALAFVVVGASSLVTPVEARKALGAGPQAGDYASSCAQGADPGHQSCRPVTPDPGRP
jgi:hypothetical protein